MNIFGLDTSDVIVVVSKEKVELNVGLDFESKAADEPPVKYPFPLSSLLLHPSPSPPPKVHASDLTASAESQGSEARQQHSAPYLH